MACLSAPAAQKARAANASTAPLILDILAHARPGTVGRSSSSAAARPAPPAWRSRRSRRGAGAPPHKHTGALHHLRSRATRTKFHTRSRSLACRSDRGEEPGILPLAVEPLVASQIAFPAHADLLQY